MSGNRSEKARVSPLLDDVALAASRYREAQEQTAQALDELRAKIREARDEGISFAAIGRSANLSLEYIRRLYAGE